MNTKDTTKYMEFLKDNWVWTTPLLVAIAEGIISGILYLIKKEEFTINNQLKMHITVI